MARVAVCAETAHLAGDCFHLWSGGGAHDCLGDIGRVVDTRARRGLYHETISWVIRAWPSKRDRHRTKGVTKGAPERTRAFDCRAPLADWSRQASRQRHGRCTGRMRRSHARNGAAPVQQLTRPWWPPRALRGRSCARQWSPNGPHFRDLPETRSEPAAKGEPGTRSLPWNDKGVIEGHRKGSAGKKQPAI